MRIHGALGTSTANLLCAINYSNLFTFFIFIDFYCCYCFIAIFDTNTPAYVCTCRYFGVGSMPNGSQIHFEGSNKFSLK